MNSLQQLRSNRKAIALIIGIIVLAVGVVSTFSLTYSADAENPYTIANEILESDDGTLIQALVYTPVDTSGNHPGVVVGHGFCENKQYMQALSIELVKRGIVVVSIDFRGHGSSDGYLGDFGRSTGLVLDMLAGVEYLEDLGFVDRIGLAGHSMGGGTSMLTALQNPTRINATVAIGALSTFTASSNITNIRNLLAVYALYDQGITEEDGQNFLRTYTGNNAAEIGTLYGNFNDGNAAKVYVSGWGEHLLEPINSEIIYETVQWFEQAFNGAQATDLQITSQYLITSLMVSLVGLFLVLFTFVSYLGSFIFKGAQKHPLSVDEMEKSPVKPIIGYLLAAFIGFVLLLPLSGLFVDIAPISMFNSVFAGQVVGLATGVVIASLIFSFKSGKFQLDEIRTRIKDMSSTSPFMSVLYGVITGIVCVGAFIAMYNWSFVASMPTTRETGVIFSLLFLLFPFFLVREFYLRGFIQERLSYSNRIREYFVMLFITIICDILIFIPVMMIGWQTVTLGFIALSLTAVTVFIILQQILVTWVYMNSGRNILGSTVFYCILFAWMVICFYPFGQSMSLIR